MHLSSGHRNSIGISTIDRKSKQPKITKKSKKTVPKAKPGLTQEPDEGANKIIRRSFSRVFDII